MRDGAIAEAEPALTGLQAHGAVYFKDFGGLEAASSNLGRRKGRNARDKLVEPGDQAMIALENVRLFIAELLVRADEVIE